jgi:hypothetical protein
MKIPVCCPHCGGGMGSVDKQIHVVTQMWATNQKRPWVARIMGRSKALGLEREFLDSIVDFSDAATFSSRTVDIQICWMVKVGWVVEVATAGKRGPERRFYRVTSPTELTEMTAEEVARWAATR